jgi:hypothetical protein
LHRHVWISPIPIVCDRDDRTPHGARSRGNLVTLAERRITMDWHLRIMRW